MVIIDSSYTTPKAMPEELARHLSDIALELFVGHDDPDILSKLMAVAIEKGHVGAVERLIKAGASVHKAYSPRIITPLYDASGRGHVEIVEVLLGAGANVEQDIQGSTALFAASVNGHVEVVKVLLAAGATIDNTSHYRSPLCPASVNGHIEVVKVLLRAGARVFAGWTILYHAYSRLDLAEGAKAVGELLDAGIDPSSFDDESFENRFSSNEKAALIEWSLDRKARRMWEAIPNALHEAISGAAIQSETSKAEEL